MGAQGSGLSKGKARELEHYYPHATKNEAQEILARVILHPCCSSLNPKATQGIVEGVWEIAVVGLELSGLGSSHKGVLNSNTKTKTPKFSPKNFASKPCA